MYPYVVNGEAVHVNTFIASMLATILVPATYCFVQKPWNADTPPRILDEDDYERIVNSDFLFCRKIERGISDILIEKLM